MKKRVIKCGITRNDLADIYQVDLKTMRSWLIEIGIEHGKILKPIEIVTIIQKIGYPDKDVEIRIPLVEIKVFKQLDVFQGAA